MYHGTWCVERVLDVLLYLRCASRCVHPVLAILLEAAGRDLFVIFVIFPRVLSFVIVEFLLVGFG